VRLGAWPIIASKPGPGAGTGGEVGDAVFPGGKAGLLAQPMYC